MNAAPVLFAAVLLSGCASYEQMSESASRLSCNELVTRCNAIAATDPRKQYIPDPGPTATGYSVNLYSSGYNSAYGTITPYRRQSLQSQYNQGVAIGNAVRLQQYNTAIQVCLDQYAARCDGR